ncbi:MAG: ABC transporter ATP-binding protein [Chloroflexota bacterium]
MEREIVLEVRHIDKSFPGVVANRDVSLQLHRGEVLALLGENGAGKTTLMNIVYGLYRQNAGEILVRGKPTHLTSPNDAIHAGIGMVHQHFMLVPVFTVAENIILGAETVKGPALDLNAARRRVREISGQFGLALDPDAFVKDLSVGLQQRVEIVKALYRKADILILDEPTAVLTPQETDDLFAIIRTLTASGASVIFISHKLKEVLAISDRIAVLRRGAVVGETTPKVTNERKLAEMMVGRDVILEVAKGPAKVGEIVLEARDLNVCDDRGHHMVNGLSLTARAGEIVGIAGVQGNGQTELVEALTGLRHIVSGQIAINGKNLTNASPRKFTESGCAHVPEDRIEDGLVVDYPVADNLILNTYYLRPFAHGPFMDDGAIQANAERLAKEYDIRTPSVMLPVANLSGGNKQKVVIARELSRPVRLLIASQPTRGLDVGSIEFVHRTIVGQRDRGTAVLFVSADLDEVMSLADRIVVMYRGEIVATLKAGETSREELGLLMAGGRPDEIGAEPPKPADASPSDATSI